MSSKERKEVVSLRLSGWMLHQLDMLFVDNRFRTRSRVIRDFLLFCLQNFSAEQWREYNRCSSPQREKAWDAFWNVIHSTMENV